MQVSSIQSTGNLKSITIKDSLWNKHTTHKYTVSNDKFDEFSAQIQDENIRWKKKTRMTMIIGTVAGATIGAAAAKNMSGAMQSLSAVLCALAGAGLSAMSLSQIFDIKHRALLSKYDVQPED